MYTRVAEDPNGDFHFHRGLRYAVEFLGYDHAELEQLPARATSRFAGVGNPLAIGPILPGQTVLDHACGAGMDLLLAAKRVGPTGRAILDVAVRPHGRSALRLLHCRDGSFALPRHDALVADVRTALTDAMKSGDASLAAIAERLGTSTRTLE
jgi:hypothetical protein